MTLFVATAECLHFYWLWIFAWVVMVRQRGIIENKNLHSSAAFLVLPLRTGLKAFSRQILVSRDFVYLLISNGFWLEWRSWIALYDYKELSVFLVGKLVWLCSCTFTECFWLFCKRRRVNQSSDVWKFTPLHLPHAKNTMQTHWVQRPHTMFSLIFIIHHRNTRWHIHHCSGSTSLVHCQRYSGPHWCSVLEPNVQLQLCLSFSCLFMWTQRRCARQLLQCFSGDVAAERYLLLEIRLLSLAPSSSLLNWISVIFNVIDILKVNWASAEEQHDVFIFPVLFWVLLKRSMVFMAETCLICFAASSDLWLPGSQDKLLAASCVHSTTFTHTLHLSSPLLPPISSLFIPPLSPNSFPLSASVSYFSPLSSFLLAHILSFHVCCTAPPPPLLCPSSLSLFFLRALGGAPCGPVVEAFLHRPQPGPPPLSGRGAGPPPPPVLLPPPPLPKLAHLRPRPPRVPPRSAPGPALHTPSLTPCSTTAHGLVGPVLVLWLTLMLCLLMFLHACLFLWLCRLQAGVVWAVWDFWAIFGTNIFPLCSGVSSSPLLLSSL